jgi:hypothetical protein
MKVVLDTAEAGAFMNGRRGRTRVREIVTFVRDWGFPTWGRRAVGNV